MIGQRLEPRAKGASPIQVVGQHGGAWVVVDVEGSSPRQLSPAALAALYVVEPVAPIVADAEVEAAGWGALAEIALASAISAARDARDGIHAPSVEDVFGEADAPA